MGSSVNNVLAGAKNALKTADRMFPSSMAPKAPAPVSAPKTSGKPAITTGDELRVKARNVSEYAKALPKLHNGGPVKADGGYDLQAGEHVLTAAEAKQARKHALMAVGMKSLAKPSRGKAK